MVDPASYITTKIASAIGGLLGGFALMSYIKPIIFAVPILQITNTAENWQMQLMFGALVGFVSYSVLGASARFFEKTKEYDIVEIINKVRGKNENKNRAPRK